MLTMASAGRIMIGTKKDGKQVLSSKSYNVVFMGGLQPGRAKEVLLSSANLINGLTFRLTMGTFKGSGAESAGCEAGSGEYKLNRWMIWCLIARMAQLQG